MNKRIGVAMLAVLGVSALAWGAWRVWSDMPIGLPDTPQRAMDDIATGRFSQLPVERRGPYIEHALAMVDKLDEAEKQKFRKEFKERLKADPQGAAYAAQAHEEFMYAQGRKYALATPKERAAVIDKVIAAMELARLQAKIGLGPKPGPPPGDAEEAKRRMRQSIERGNPQTQAYVAEFVQDLMAKRKSMGLEPLPLPQPQPAKK